MHIGVVLGTLEGIEASFVLGLFFAHLAFFIFVPLAFTTSVVVVLLLQPLRDDLILLLGWLDQELGEPLVVHECIQRQRLWIGWHRKHDQQQHTNRGEDGAGIGLCAPVNFERHGHPLGARRTDDIEGIFPEPDVNP